MRVSLRQTTRHCRLVASTSSTKVKTSGIPTGLITSSAAPVFEKLRTVQLIPPPPNVIVPAFSTRCLGAFRPSSMAFTYALKYRNGGLPTVNVSAQRPVMKKSFAHFADETGVTAMEHGLIAAGISLAIIAVVNGLGTRLNSKFTSINRSSIGHIPEFFTESARHSISDSKGTYAQYLRHGLCCIYSKT